MAHFIVTHVRKELSADRRHRHLSAVYAAGNWHTLASVVASIRSGSTWVTSAAGKSASIRPLANCPQCTKQPYITTRPDDSVDDNLENLPEA